MKRISFKARILILSNAITLIVMIVLGTILTIKGKENLEEGLKNKMDVLTSSLALSTRSYFWNFDTNSLAEVRNEIKKDKEIVELEFLDKDKKEFLEVKEENSDLKEKSHAVSVFPVQNDKKEDIGYISLHYSNAQTMRKVTESIYTIVGLVLVGQLIISVSISLVVSNLSRNLAIVVSGLKKTSVETSTSSSNLKNSSSKLSATATEQASAIQETVSTLDEITSMVQTSASNAQDSSKRADQCYNVTMEGQKSIADMEIVMRKIVSNNQQVRDQMDENGRNLDEIIHTINEISSKTNVINDIVFQTKLLSFNASVEAARAGESGKGFAVVAEEVGSLAAMSGKASQEISELLASSVEKVGKIASHSKVQIGKIVAEGEGQVKEIGEMIEKCSHSFDNVVENVSEVKSMMEQVASAVREQSEGVSNISQAMNELDSSVQQNSQSASEAADHANGLSAQSLELDRMVNLLVANLEGRGKKTRKNKLAEYQTDSEENLSDDLLDQDAA